jgi:hypothetical protein
MKTLWAPLQKSVLGIAIALGLSALWTPTAVPFTVIEFPAAIAQAIKTKGGWLSRNECALKKVRCGSLVEMRRSDALSHLVALSVSAGRVVRVHRE